MVALSNEDGIRFVSSVAREIAGTLLQTGPAPQPVASARETQQVRAILEGLQKGHVDRALFTANANSYFSDTALADFKSSLATAGKLRTISRTGEELRGGMTHLSYRAEFARKTLALNIYLMPDGKFEQFMVEDQI